jgi:equilibrative nucleoside transporter 1/2/3
MRLVGIQPWWLPILALVMNGNESPTRTRGTSRDTGGNPSAHPSDTSKATKRIHRIYFLLGAAILLPWNAMITTFPYSLERLADSHLRSTFASYFSAVYQLASFGALAHASYTSSQVIFSVSY